MTNERKPLARFRHFDMPLFDQRVYFVDNMDDYNYFLEEIGFPPSHPAQGKGGWYTENNGQTHFIVGVMNGLPSTLVHECSHVVHFMCKYVGIKVEYGGVNETFCYMMGALYDGLMPLLDASNRKREKADAKKYKDKKNAAVKK